MQAGRYDIVKPEMLNLSVSGILNDDYEGGELQFRTLSLLGEISVSVILNVVCKKGDLELLVFPSYINHRVKPVTKGVRYSVVAWYGGPPFK